MEHHNISRLRRPGAMKSNLNEQLDHINKVHSDTRRALILGLQELKDIAREGLLVEFSRFTTAGIDLIAAERKRQLEQEGYTLGHDDSHDNHQLALAAAAYAMPAVIISPSHEWHTDRDELYPFDLSTWKPSPDDRLRELVKAGALISAEIERILRANEKPCATLPVEPAAPVPPARSSSGGLLS